jgi:hypothetical protein
MPASTCVRSMSDALSQFLTPAVFKQAHQACPPKQQPSRWKLHPLIWVLLGLAWLSGDSEEERFAAARAAYVSCHQHDRRPGESLAGFLLALARLPMCVLRALAAGVRGQLAILFVAALRINGWVPLACDGSRLECPRSEELQARLGESGKPESPPMLYLTTLVLLPVGLLWSWRLGKGTASEHNHLRHLLATLPSRALIVADACFMGYELFSDIMVAEASFLVRLSSRAYLYTEKEVPLERFREGLVYYWPEHMRDKGLPPLKLRLLRVRGKKCDVWLLTNVLQREQLSHKLAGQLYRWRWRNEGLFRVYKRQLGKLKLSGRTVALVHREAEGSLLALQLLLAVATQAVQRGHQTVLITDSPRRVLLVIRGHFTGLLRDLGPRQFARYQWQLQVVRGEAPRRRSGKVRQVWPRRSDHKPPKPPKLRVLTDPLKAKMKKVLQRIESSTC